MSPSWDLSIKVRAKDGPTKNVTNPGDLKRDPGTGEPRACVHIASKSRIIYCRLHFDGMLNMQMASLKSHHSPLPGRFSWVPSHWHRSGKEVTGSEITGKDLKALLKRY